MLKLGNDKAVFNIQAFTHFQGGLPEEGVKFINIDEHVVESLFDARSRR